MANLALHKPVNGALTPTAATDGDITNYGSHKGWSCFRWPGQLTVDLESVHLITCIRFLLYDKEAKREYKYRLLTSKDGKNWDVLFDDEKTGRLGWQVFSMPPQRLSARYVRIHGLWNSSNDSFHIVQVEVYDDEPPKLDSKINLQVEVILSEGEVETDQTMDIEQDFEDLRWNIQDLDAKSPGLIPPYFHNSLNQLQPQVKDIAEVQRSAIGIRRQIMKPIEQELQKSSRLSAESMKLSRYSPWGFWVGLAALLVGIFSGILTIIAIIRML